MYAYVLIHTNFYVCMHVKTCLKSSYRGSCTQTRISCYMYTFINTYICTNTYNFIRMYAYANIPLIFVSGFVHADQHRVLYLYIWKYVYTYTDTYDFIWFHMCVCIRAHTSDLCIGLRARRPASRAMCINSRNTYIHTNTYDCICMYVCEHIPQIFVSGFVHVDPHPG